MATKNPQKNPPKYICKLCDYYTSSSKDYKKHLLTLKHQIATKSTEKIPKNAELFCECGKKYKDRSGLWRHKKKCSYHVEEKKPEDKIICSPNEEKSSLAKELVPLIKDLIVDIVPVLQPNNTINNFNINMFLNEQCKDAINMSDFIKSIEVTVKDLEKFGVNGQAEGMSTLLIDRLSSMDVFHRPMHCSDPKKEIIYIKDEDKWEQEQDDKPKFKHALDEITKKSIKNISNIEDEDIVLKACSEVLKDPREDKKILSKIAKKICIHEG